MATKKLMELKLEQVVVSGDNCRIIDEKSAGFKELVASIAGAGVRIPVHVCSIAGDKDKYKLLAGERRYRASLTAGRATIPAIDHGALTEQEEFDITFTENFSRQDLTALEEAKAVATLLSRHRGDVEQVATDMGRSPRWVAARSRIHERLSKKWLKVAAAAPGDWTAGHLALLVRYPKGVQDEILGGLYWEIDREERVAVKKLEERLVKCTRQLRRAKWKLDDGKLVKAAGACNDCNKRSCCQPLLWQEEGAAAADNDDKCLDKNCWDKKSRAYLVARLAELRKKNPALLCVAVDYFGYREEEDLKKDLGAVLSHHQFDKAKKGARGAVAALVVSGAGIGSVCWVKVCKSRSGAAKKAAGPKSLKEKTAGLEAKRWAKVLEELSEMVSKAKLRTITIDNKLAAVAALAAVFGTDDEKLMNRGWNDLWDLLDKPAGALGDEIDLRLWDAVRSVIADDLCWCGPVTQTPKRKIDAAEQVGKLLGIDVVAMFEDVAGRKGFTTPVAWAKQAEK